MYERNADEYWNKFYTKHEDKFFKDRNWFSVEFPEFFADADRPVRILEMGCGAGNSVFPIMKEMKNAFVYACDFSTAAVDLVRVSSVEAI